VTRIHLVEYRPVLILESCELVESQDFSPDRPLASVIWYGL
jgi:hypothetical protein